MTHPLHISLVGVGGFGGAHLEAIEKLEQEGLVKLVAVVDSSATRLAELKDRLEKRGVHWYTDFQKMLQEEMPLEAVAIATPIHLHERMTVAAVARSLFVYLEKPPVPLIQQLINLMALDARGKVCVNFQGIRSIPMLQLKRWKLEGALGTIRSIRVSGAWPRTTQYYQRTAWAGKMMMDNEMIFDGPATNALAHQLNNVMFLAGSAPAAFDVPTEVEGEFYRARPIEGYDAACLRGKFASGMDFCYAVTHATEKHSGVHIELIGDQGRAWLTEDGALLGNDLGLDVPPPPYPDPFLESYRAFAEFARGRRPRAGMHLREALGYTLATNGALMSSGGIHAIPPAHVRAFETGDPQGYDITGLTDALPRVIQEGILFSQMGFPWTRKGRTVSLKNLRSINLRDYIPH